MADHIIDENERMPLIEDPNNEPIKFVNEVVSTGHLNGNINLEFATLRFSASADLQAVLPNRIVGARMRMDLHCAAQLHSALGAFLAQLTKPADTKDN